MIKKLLPYVYLIYIIPIEVFGVYGFRLSDFSPSNLTVLLAVCLSIIFFVGSSSIAFLYLKKYKERIGVALKRKYKFYVFSFFGVPYLLAILSMFHFHAFSMGLPNIYTNFNARAETDIVLITNKKLWGKQNRNGKIYISGFRDGFPVSRKYYDSVSAGQKISIIVKRSTFGTRVEFTAP